MRVPAVIVDMPLRVVFARRDSGRRRVRASEHLATERLGSPTLNRLLRRQKCLSGRLIAVLGRRGRRARDHVCDVVVRRGRLSSVSRALRGHMRWSGSSVVRTLRRRRGRCPRVLTGQVVNCFSEVAPRRCGKGCSRRCHFARPFEAAVMGPGSRLGLIRQSLLVAGQGQA